MPTGKPRRGGDGRGGRPWEGGKRRERRLGVLARFKGLTVFDSTVLRLRDFLA